MANELSLQERLAKAREAKAKREAKAQQDREAAELARLELEERLEAQLGGPVGRAFAIVDASEIGEGHIAVKLGEDVLWNAFKASKMNVVDVDAFVTPCVVHPTVDDFRKIVKRRPFIADRCATALAALYGAEATATAGK